MDPIEVLEEKLKEYKIAFNKSNELFIDGKITKELYHKHYVNLMFIINKYKNAIKKLKQ